VSTYDNVLPWNEISRDYLEREAMERLSARQARDAAHEVASADKVPQNATEGLTELSEGEEEVSTKYLESISFETDQLLKRRYR
jgi:hypothetical protein